MSYLFYGCAQQKEVKAYIKDIPDEINSHFVVSEINNTLYYSSNKENTFHIYEFDLHKKLTALQLEIDLEQDVFVRSVSHDGRYLSFVSDINGNQFYDIFIYNLKDQKLFNITKSLEIDDGNPKFAPTQNLLAFLSDGHLKLFDVERKKNLHKSNRIFKDFTWGQGGDMIFLEDNYSNIWEMNLSKLKYKKIWASPSKSFVPKMFNNKNDGLLFISDHSGFSNIYNLDVFSKEIIDSISLGNDLYSPDLKGDESVIFRMNTKGSLLNYRINSEGRINKITSQKKGVSYQFYSNDTIQINLFAGADQPKRFLIDGESYSSQEEKIKEQGIGNKIEVFKDEEDVCHYLFLPKNRKIKGWLVWLHGGPHEQISPRYNVFMDYINQAGWAIIALNYKGSTGMGNDYEMRNVLDPQLRLDIQIEDVKKSLKNVKENLDINEEKFILLGVSYGARLAHSYFNKYPDSIIKIIDFSGLPVFHDPSHLDLSEKDFLFISGENDFALNDSKVAMIEYYQKHSSVELLILKNEGHYIRRKNSIINSLNKIIQFLNE